jgi:hypothetical protein
MNFQPELQTDRLVLREFTVEGAPVVQRLVGEWEVARTMRHILHPYEDDWAEEWSTAAVRRSRPESGCPSPRCCAKAGRSSAASRCT